MKFAVLSDLHGNLPGLEVVIRDWQDYQPDCILVAGDLTGGPFPNEVIEQLASLNALMILGNSDIRLLEYCSGEGPADWRTSNRFGLLRWNASHIHPANLDLLRSLPGQRVAAFPGVPSIRIVHGTPWDAFYGIDPVEDLAIIDRTFAEIPETVLLCGHSHRPWYLFRNGGLALNPGAIAGPLNGETGAQYARLTWMDNVWQVELRTVGFQFEALRSAFESSGLLGQGGAIARGFLYSLETGRDITLEFIDFASQMALEAGYTQESIPDDIWDAATEMFDWEKKGRE